jgi:N-acetylneuraminic acid mutarotase
MARFGSRAPARDVIAVTAPARERAYVSKKREGCVMRAIGISHLAAGERTTARRLVLGIAAVFVLLSLQGYASVAGAPGPGSWSAGPSIAAARHGHTATTLDEPGTAVLVAGGTASGSALASATRYYVSSGAWIAVPDMAIARQSHTAARLASGDVLIAGGSDGAVALSGVERFVSSSNTWSSAPSLAGARFMHTATVLADGRVLVAGGSTGGTTSLASVEIYDPVANSWSSGGTLGIARRQHTATTLSDGRVLITGGVANGSTASITSAEIYNPQTNTWSAAAALATARSGHTATLLTDNTVLVAGGDGPSGPLATAARYDPAANTWTAVASFSGARSHHVAARLTHGLVLIAGGSGAGDLASAQLYNPFLNSWSTAGSMASARRDATASLLSDGNLFVVAGSASGAALATVEQYDPGTWSSRASMSVNRTGHSATVLKDGRVLVAGGLTSSGVTATTELYNPSTDTWSSAAGMNEARQRHSVTVLRDGRVFVAGGMSGTAPSSALAGAEIYDPVADTWTATASMSSPRVEHSASLLLSISFLFPPPEPAVGEVLVLGGFDGSSAVASGAIYSVATNSWTGVTSMPVARRRHSATVLDNGNVIVAGGRDASGVVLASTHTRAASTGAWSTTASLSGPRELHATIRSLENTVYVSGGSDGTATLSSAERYVPASDTWSPAGSMASARSDHVFVPVANGQFIAAGGDNGTSDVASVDRYDPLTNSWRATAAMAASRAGGAGVLLLDGHLLTTGGSGLSSVEAYNFSAMPSSPGQSFIFPIDCVINAECWYHNYVDEDRVTNGVLDFACGYFTYNTHDGTDIPIPSFAMQDQGVDVYAADGGVVIFTEDGNFDKRTSANPTFRSNTVVVVHPSGVATAYLHLRKDSVGVTKGQQVTRGQRVGQIGSSGSSTGPHLHFSAYDLHSRRIDPWKNPVNPNCGGATSLWLNQAPYENFFLQLGHSLWEPPFSAIDGESSVAALSPTATDLCYVANVLSPQPGDALQHRFVGPATTHTLNTPIFSNPRSFSPTYCIDDALLRATPGIWLAEFRHNGTLMSSREFAVCPGTCTTGVHRSLYSTSSAPTNNSCTVDLVQVGDGSGPNGIQGTADCTTAHGGTITNGTLNQAVFPRTISVTISFTSPPLTVVASGEVSDDGSIGSGNWDCVPITCLGTTYSSNRLAATESRRLRAPAGGIIVTAAGDQLIVPAGSLASDTLITSDITPLTPPPPAGVRVISRRYQFGPSGTTFSPAATLVLHYTDEDVVGGLAPTNLRVMVYNSVTSNWELVGGVVDQAARTVTVTIDHFSDYALFDCATGLVDTDADGTGDACDTDDDADGCTDTEELGPNLAFGGMRNPLNRWDFADVPVPALPLAGAARDGAVSLSDVGAALIWVGRVNNGAAHPNPPYRDYDNDDNTNGIEDGAEYDRTPNGQISGPPDGAISLTDVGVILAQVGDNCVAAPN